MILNIICDDRRPEKLPLLQAEMLRQGISYTLWSAEILPNVVESINASHRKIVQYAKNHRLPVVCIAEEDCLFPAVDGWKYWLKNRPIDFDIYSAGTYGGVQNNHPLSNVGAHCYMVHEKYYDRFLAKPTNLHVDTAQDGADIWVCYPFAAIQRPGWSENNKEYVNYNTILTDKDVYGGLPKEELRHP